VHASPADARVLGEGGDQTAPLGRAVVGGLVGATLATLLIVPALFAILQRDTTRKTASLDPADPDSRYFHANGEATPDTSDNRRLPAPDAGLARIPEGALHE
jgi:hypothetical protein